MSTLVARRHYSTTLPLVLSKTSGGSSWTLAQLTPLSPTGHSSLFRHGSETFSRMLSGQSAALGSIPAGAAS